MAYKSFDINQPENCLCFSLRRAARLVTRAYDEALEPIGLTATQFTLLAILKGGGSITTTNFAKSVALERTSLTRNLALLERDQLICRQPGKDLRERIITISTKGARRLEEAMPIWTKVQTGLVSKLGVQPTVLVLENTKNIEDAFKTNE